jgi:MSHA biogenesis protein MshK
MKLINRFHFTNQLKLTLVVLLCIANTLYIRAALAEGLKDPTQPPASLYSASGQDTAVSPGPVLQSVMIGTQYRAAIINGEKVMLGKKYQQATLIKVNEHEAVLRNPDMSTQTLSMDYAIEKKILPPAATPFIKSKQHSSKPIAVSEK